MANRKTRSLLVTVLAVCLLVAVSLCGWLYTGYRRFSDQALLLASNEPVLVVERGDGFRDIVAKLRQLGIREGHDLHWRVLAMEMDVVSRLQVGDYELGQGLTPRELLAKLAKGDVIQHRFTVVEGWNFRELRAALAQDRRLQQTLDDLADPEVMALLDRPGVHPEGHFLPETYHYTRGTRDRDVLRRAMLAMDTALADIWSSRAPGLPIETPAQLLTLASIVEKETGKASERPEIAGVFIRRLQLGMRLQTDPTVIYGMGASYAGNIRKRDLETDTPYNTYTRAGLPPTPIALPGLDALRAAAHPAPGNSLYFVARGDGSHVFSSTLAAHNRAVACYQLKRCP